MIKKMPKPSKTILKKLNPRAQIDLMIEAAHQHNTPLLKTLVQILIEQDRINEVATFDEHLQQAFLQALEQLLISAIHHHNQSAFLQIIKPMQIIKKYAHPIDLYYDIIPLNNFADALAEKHHEAFLSLIRKKHFLDDNYLLFLAFKTENLKLLYQLHQLGLNIQHETIALLVEQKKLIPSEPQRQFIKYLLDKELEKPHEPKTHPGKKK